MSDSKLKNPTSGWWSCTNVETKETRVYHHSTANVLEKKGMLIVGAKQKAYVPVKEKK